MGSPTLFLVTLERGRLDRELAAASVANAKNSRTRVPDRGLRLNKATNTDSGCYSAEHLLTLWQVEGGLEANS